MLSVALGAMPGSPGKYIAGPRPSVTSVMRIRHAELKAALRTLIEPIPEADGRFRLHAGVPSARERQRRNRKGWHL